MINLEWLKFNPTNCFAIQWMLIWISITLVVYGHSDLFHKGYHQNDIVSHPNGAWDSFSWHIVSSIPMKKNHTTSDQYESNSIDWKSTQLSCFAIDLLLCRLLSQQWLSAIIIQWCKKVVGWYCLCSWCCDMSCGECLPLVIKVYPSSSQGNCATM